LNGYAGLDQIPTLLSEAEVQQIKLDDILRAIGSVKQYERRMNAVRDDIAAVSAFMVSNIDNLNTVIDDVTAEDRRLDDISKIIDDVKRRKQNLKRAQDEFAIADTGYTEATAALDAFRVEIGSCPLCGSALCEDGDKHE
jgi:uncharacterized alpha-E superfamily protein